ncbi:HCP-like protein [Linnemannia elongata AG-77]|uniref:HCP-like protein n=1 Tax=Linnemannia elongata AG-77 TaxID=1314771 RepID=A0A197JYX2_9FUNG|nr:HCP-like protein [Linnemannia elongata AG-77]
MVQSLDEHQDIGIQVIRLVGSNSRTVHITTHQDPSSGKHIVLWADILQVFRSALYLQHGQRVLPFMKGNDFKDLDPPRIAAIPSAILDIVIEGSPLVDNDTWPPQDPMIQDPYEMENTYIDLSARRNPVEGDEMAAMENYTHMDRPNFLARGPQFYPDRVDNNSSPVLRPRNREGIVFDYEYLSVADDAHWSTKIGQQGATIETLAEEEDAEAQYQTGREYGWPNPTSNGYVQAMEWYLRAAKQGHVKAQCEIGRLYENGLGRPVDIKMAFEWYLKAAEGGSLFSQKQVSAFYANGHGGVPRDDTKALEWARRAAEQELWDREFESGEMYEVGRGAPKDHVKAMEWYSKAADKGSASAVKRLNDLKNKYS